MSYSTVIQWRCGYVEVRSCEPQLWGRVQSVHSTPVHSTAYCAIMTRTVCTTDLNVLHVNMKRGWDTTTTMMLNGRECWVVTDAHCSVLSSVTKPRPAAVLEPGSEVGWVKRALTFPLSLYYPPSTIEAGPPGQQQRRCSRSPAAAAAGPRLEARVTCCAQLSLALRYHAASLRTEDARMKD